MKYKAAIFDMDGTILDTLQDLHNTLNYALKINGLPERTIDETRAFVGNGIRRLVELGVPVGTSSEQIEEVFRIFNEHYAVHCKDCTKPYDGIIDLVQNIRKQGIRTAVVSNKTDYAVQALCTEFFDGVFDASLGVTDRIRRKPAADMVEVILERMGCRKEDAVYIGDSEVDLMTAENAKMDCIAVTWGFRSEDHLVREGAEVIVSDMDELYLAITNDGR